MPIGLAFWINGKLEDWDPVTVTASNTTVTSDGAYENVTTYRSLHPCNDAAELAAIATPAGIISTTPSGSTEPAPSVRGTRHERARVGGALTRGPHCAAPQIWKSVYRPVTDAMTVMHTDVTVRLSGRRLVAVQGLTRRLCRVLLRCCGRSNCTNCWTTTPHIT